MTTRTRKVWGIHPGDSADELEHLVHEVYVGIIHRPVGLGSLKQAMVALLSYLESPQGRTNFNCTVVNNFFCIRDQWESEWVHLPIEIRCILEAMGGELHDTISSPDIARNFEATPEQLLAKVRGVAI